MGIIERGRGLQFLAQGIDYGNRVQIALLQWHMDRKSAARAAVIHLYEVPEMGIIEEPFLDLEMRDAQSLMDALYSAGVRVSKSLLRGDEGAQLESVKYHLEDMRRLVFEEKPELTRVVMPGDPHHVR